MTVGNIHSIESLGTVDGPGIRFVVFLQGCPLRCQYCHNPDTWDPKGECQYRMTAEELLAETERYRSFIQGGGVTLTGGEPLLQAEFVKEYFSLCRKAGLHTALDTSGCLLTPAAKAALEHTDLVLLDIKTMDPELYPVLTGGSLDRNLAFLDYLEARGIRTWIRHVVVPGLTDSDDALHALGRKVAQYKVVERIEVQPYHTMGTFKYEKLGLAYPLDGVPPLSRERLSEVRSLLSAYKPTL